MNEELELSYQDNVLRLSDLKVGDEFTYLGKTMTKIAGVKYNAIDDCGHFFNLPSSIAVEELSE